MYREQADAVSTGLRGEQGQLLDKIFSLKLLVVHALILNIGLNDIFVAVLSHSVHVVAARPEFASPEDLRDLGVQLQEFPCGEALDDLDDAFGGLHGDGLHEEMHMILICTYIHKLDFVRHLNLRIHLFERMFNCLGEDLLPVLGRTDEVVLEKGDVVALLYMLFHVRILPVDVKPEGSAAELRGKVPLGFFGVPGERPVRSRRLVGENLHRSARLLATERKP